MQNTKLKKILLFLAFSLSILFPTFSTAQAATSTGFVSELNAQTKAATVASGLGSAQDPRSIAARLIQIFLSLIGILLIIYVVYGGSLIFMSGGSEDKVNEGKGVIRRAIIGLIIILGAYSITILVNSVIQNEGPCKPDANGDINCDIIEPDRSKYNNQGGYQNNPTPNAYFDCKYLPDGTCDLSD